MLQGDGSQICLDLLGDVHVLDMACLSGSALVLVCTSQTPGQEMTLLSVEDVAQLAIARHVAGMLFHQS